MTIADESQNIPKCTKRAAGRKPAHESRAQEIRARLLVWKQTPESMRPSLRALAGELGTSHQMLAYYLGGLDTWRAEEQAKRIRARAKAENRDLTMQELINTMITPGILADIESLRRAGRRGPLDSYQVKTLKVFAKNFPAAQEVLATSRAMTKEEEVAHREAEAKEELEEKLEKVCARAKAKGLPWTPRDEKRYVAWLRSVQRGAFETKISSASNKKPQVPR